MIRKKVLQLTAALFFSVCSLTACAGQTCSSELTKQTLLRIAGEHYARQWGPTTPVDGMKAMTQISGVMTTATDKSTGTRTCRANIEFTSKTAHAGGQIDYMVTTDDSGKPMVRYDPQQFREATWVRLTKMPRGFDRLTGN